MQTDLNEAIERLENALTGPDGELIPIERIEFERIGRQVRWSLFAQGGRRLYAATDQAGDLTGWLTATGMLLAD